MNEQVESIQQSVCLTCLTVSRDMKRLSEKMFATHEENTISLKEALDMLLNKKVPECDDFPLDICHQCVSSLKIAYNFKRQCESSQRLLYKVLGNVNYDDINSLYSHVKLLKDTDVVKDIQTTEEINLEHFSHEEGLNWQVFNHKDSTNLTDKKENVPVELLVRGTCYNLNEVVIVENEAQEDASDTFSGFLRNLGTEISAKFVNKSSYRFQVPRHNEELSVIIKNVVNEAEEEFMQTNENETEDIHDNLTEDEPSKSDNELEIPLLHKCHQCSKVYNKKHTLTKHINVVHKKLNVKPLRCEQCGHLALTKDNLKKHQVRHGPRMHACTTCGKRYLTPTELKVHENTHTRSRQFLCNVCGRSFLYPNALKSHIRWHAGERRYSCPHCPKAFLVQSGLIRHLRIHTGERPYKCKYCGKRFAGLGAYKVHVMGHTGRSVYRCTYCHQGFHICTRLKLHLLTHPGPHKCQLCRKTFIEMHFLRIHMWYTHRDSCDDVNTPPTLDYSPYRISKSEVTQDVF